MNANLVIQWVIVGAVIGWALWFVASRLGLFAWVMGRKPSTPQCGSCKHCAPPAGMQKMLKQMEDRTAGKM